MLQVEDLSDQVNRTWWICIRRALGRLATRPRYLRFLMDGHARNRVFAVTLLRIMIAYRTRSMRYCLLVFERAGCSSGRAIGEGKRDEGALTSPRYGLGAMGGCRWTDQG